MSKEMLTDRSVAGAKAQPGKRLEIWDARMPGLCLRVTDTGVKTFVYRYRTPDGRQPRFTIGKVPAISLRDARDRAADLAREVAKGGDPATDRRKARAFASGSLRTFNDLADLFEKRCASGEWMPKGKRKRQRTLDDENSVLRLHIRPSLGKMPYTAIGRADVRAVLRKMTARGIGAQANRTHALIRQVFNFAISEELVTTNPTVGVNQPAPNNARSRVWTDAELKALWSALNDFENIRDEDGTRVAISEIMALAIKLCAVVGQRRQEVTGMEVAEVDLDAKVWVIPALRMKGNRPHLVPLSDPAVAIIKKAIEVSNRGRENPSAYVFRTSWEDDRPILPGSLSRAILRVTRALKIKNATAHDLRRTMSSTMTSERLKVSHFIRSEVIAHSTTGGGAAVSMQNYDVNGYVSEKRDALERWANLLMVIVGAEDAPSNVTPIREAVA